MYQEAVSTLALFFQRNIILVYFFYGLAFFSMGLLILLETNRSSSFRIARALTLLAGFGIFHGLHEWFEMFQRLAEAGAADIPPWLLLDEIRVPHLVISFVFLILFGIRLIYANRVGGTNENFFAIFAAGTLLAVWFTSVLITRSVYHPSQGEFVTAVDVLSRYILGIPGALLAAWAIILEQRAFRVRGMSAFGRSLLWGAVALILYGLIGQIFPNPSFLFPANIVNSQLFLELFGFPVQLFRTMMAVAMAVLMVRALRAFDLEQSQRLALANSERLAAQHKALEVQRQARREMEILNQQLQQACEALSAREALRAELLRQVVTAQEQERQRVARELHDGTGQILTGLGLGLAAASENLPANPELAGRQLESLKGLSAQALQELRLIISDLRPAVLDDLGLVPALHGQVQSLSERRGVDVSLRVTGHRQRLQPEVETVVFRIAQEALNNIAKHAQAEHAWVVLDFSPDTLKLVVEDDGIGFNPERVLKGATNHRHAWGLLGLEERASLVGGECHIQSQPGAGTRIQVTVPLRQKSPLQRAETDPNPEPV